ncbi:pilus assembly protein [Allochromatium palmeri]|uniref:Pilus assembly protein PilY n=1 Tax=Allochromatium palmeri TaxID=231048 RepID=A0A6N8EKH2_9GAMM|nr:PilC/PilY family type IV pilus protein [Allochromatium palmeri]MTW23047.1 pilus assembly protein PilY [Allochromatium palmeri]
MKNLMQKESQSKTVSLDAIIKDAVRSFLALPVVFFFVVLVAFSPSILLATDISQVPLYVGGQVAPNIIFNIDESWSMAWRYMPDSVREDNVTIYGNPWATSAGDGGDDNKNRWTLAFHPDDVSTGGAGTSGNDSGTGDAITRTLVARADASGVATDLISARLRSSAFNTIYYDPEVRYRPWYNHDGSVFLDADPAAAPLNPNNTSAGTVDLVGEQTFSTSRIWCGSLSDSTANSTSVSNLSVDNGASNTQRNNFCQNITGEKLAPAVYYTSNGNGFRNAANFTRERIMDHSTFERGSGRTDCAAIASGTGNTCTQAEEYKNFANWFTYNRTRMFLAIAATSRAFAEQEDGMRVGYARIHGPDISLDGVNSPGTMVRGVRDFRGTDRQSFFTWLHALGGEASTASRQSLYGTAGTHHQFAGATPLRAAMDDVGQYFSRSDNRGPWGHTPGVDDSTLQLTCRKSYHILMTDGMWNGDAARTSSARSNVDGSAGSSISGDGEPYQYQPTAPYSDSVSNTLADVAMYYWNRDLRTDLANNVPPDSSNPAFWQHMVNFTIGLGVNGTLDFPGDWDVLQAGTKSWPTVTSNTSTAIDDLWHAAVNSHGEYLSTTNPEQFATALSNTLSNIINRSQASTTSMLASSVFLETDSGIYQGTYDSSDWSGNLTAYVPSVADNTLQLTETWDAESSMPTPANRNILTHDGSDGITFQWTNLTNNQKTALGNDENVLNFLRGIRTDEGTTYRERGGVLGDIVNSDPVYVHKENFGFYSLSGTLGSSYITFTETKASRTPMVYVGANDGMLHAFNADTGVEVFAYVPRAVYPNLKSLSEPEYAHKYFVDGDTHVSDAYLSNAWKTILLGTTGAGGKSVFAIDVTNPTTVSASSVLWEITDTTSGFSDLGYTMGGEPVIARLNDGTWASIFGNGYDSTQGKAVLYIVNLNTGALIKAIEADSSGANGLSGPAFYYQTDDSGTYAAYVYAGDLKGNLWKFDLTASNKNSWDVAFTQGQNKYPLFTAKNDYNDVQPITATPDLRRHDEGGYIVLFGTGKYFSVSDLTDVTVQSVYGIWDDNSSRITDQRSNTLVEQTIDYEGDYGDFHTRVLSENSVDWDAKRGWFLDLVSPNAGKQGERVVQPVQVWFDRLRVATTIPNEDPCEGGGSGWYMEIDLKTGGRLNYPVFDLDGDGEMDMIALDGQSVPVTGIALSNIGVMPAQIGDYLAVDTDNQDNNLKRDSGLGSIKGRQTWREIR